MFVSRTVKEVKRRSKVPFGLKWWRGFFVNGWGWMVAVTVAA
jgi:hypothetical protein